MEVTWEALIAAAVAVGSWLAWLTNTVRQRATADANRDSKIASITKRVESVEKEHKTLDKDLPGLIQGLKDDVRAVAGKVDLLQQSLNEFKERYERDTAANERAHELIHSRIDGRQRKPD